MIIVLLFSYSEAVNVVSNNRLTKKVKLKNCGSVYAACNLHLFVQFIHVLRGFDWNGWIFFFVVYFHLWRLWKVDHPWYRFFDSEYLEGIRVIMSVDFVRCSKIDNRITRRWFHWLKAIYLTPWSNTFDLPLWRNNVCNNNKKTRIFSPFWIN